MLTLKSYISKIYEPSYTEEKIQSWTIRLIVILFIIFTFHIIHDLPIFCLNIVNIILLLYITYVILLMFYASKITQSIILQFTKLWIDFIFITSFDYLSLIHFGEHSWIYILYLIPLIYCSFWFNIYFSTFFVTLISITYFILINSQSNLSFGKTDISQSIVSIGTPIIIFYVVISGVLFHKRKIKQSLIYIEKLNQQYLHELSVLNEIGRSVGVSDISLIAENIYIQTTKLISTTNFYISIYDEKTKKLNYLYWIHNGDLIPSFSEKKSGLSGWIIDNKKSLLIMDWLKEEKKFPVKPKIHTAAQRSWLGVPMLIGELIIGMISLQHDKPNMFNSETQRLLETIASQAAIAVENVRHLKNEKKLREEAENLRKIQQEISSTFKYEETANRIIDKLAIIVNYKKASFQLIQGDNRIIIAGIGINMDNMNPFLQRPISEDSLIQKVLNSRSPLLINDTREDQSWTSSEGTEDVFSWMCIPLIYDDLVIAIITIDHDQPRFYTKDDMEKVFKYATQEASGFNKSLLFYRAQNRIKAMDIVNEVVKIISTKLDTKDLLESIVSEIVQKLNCHNCTLFLSYKENGKSFLRTEETQGLFSESIRNYVCNLSEDGEKTPIGWVFKKGRTQIFDNVNADFRFKPKTERRHSERPMIIAPVIVGDQTIGVFSILMKEFDWFKESDILLIDSLALHVGIAIERDFGLDLVQKISNKIMMAYNIKDILEEIVLGAINLTNTDSGVIYLINDTGTEVIDSFWPTGSFHPKPRLTEKKGITRQVIESKKMISISDIKKYPDINPDLINSYCSMIAVPLLLNERVVGVLFLNSVNKHIFNDIQVSFILTLVNQAAIVLEKTKLNQQLTDSVALYHSLVEQSPDSIILYEDNKITFANKTAIKLLGKNSLDDLKKHSIFDFIHPDDKSLMLKKLSMLSEKKDPKRMIEIKLRKHNGEIVEVEVYGNNTQKDKEIQLVLHDLSRMKVLLKEMHHHVRKSLNMVYGYLYEQEKLANSTEVISKFRAMRTRIQTMALVHTILYRTNESSSVAMKDYFEEVYQAVFKAYEVNTYRIKCTINIKEINLENKKAIECGLIFNELLSNSIIHAFDNIKGEIMVELKKVDKFKYQFLYSDNGNGMDIDSVTPLESMGFKILDRLVYDQLKGQIKRQSINGLSYEILFSK